MNTIWRILYYIRPIALLLLGVWLFQTGERQWGFLLIIFAILDFVLSKLKRIEIEIIKLKEKIKDDKNRRLANSS